MAQTQRTLLKNNKPRLSTQVLHLLQVYLLFSCLGYRFSESTQIRERKLQGKGEDSPHSHMRTAKVTAGILSDNEEREN